MVMMRGDPQRPTDAQNEYESESHDPGHQRGPHIVTGLAELSHSGHHTRPAKCRFGPVVAMRRGRRRHESHPLLNASDLTAPSAIPAGAYRIFLLWHCMRINERTRK